MNRNESEVLGRTMKHLEEKCGQGHVYHNINFTDVWYKDGKSRAAGADVDVVGIFPDGTAFVCEVKDATLREASKGLGQLLMYRVFVEHGFSEFKGALSFRGENQDRLEMMSLDRVRYLLVLPETKKTLVSEQILKEVLSYIRDPAPKVDLLYV